jgi:cytochrome c
MSGFELNKIVAAILLSSLIAMMAGFLANILYKPKLKPETRGYSVAVTEDSSQGTNTAPAPAAVDIEALMKTANAGVGKEIVKKCITCHSFDKGGSAKIGPNLWGVAGTTIANIPSYKFSTALSGIKGNWTDANLFHFINKPSKFAPGTKMSFAGLSKPEDIVNVIAFLKSLKD